jgi:hypothetical protein
MALGFSAVIIRGKEAFHNRKEKAGNPLRIEKLSVDYDRLRNDVLMAIVDGMATLLPGSGGPGRRHQA